jgi:hypothetical protein
LPRQLVIFAWLRAFARAGSNMAARIAMMDTTTRSSIKVKTVAV